jgi:hypothetical protein
MKKIRAKNMGAKKVIFNNGKEDFEGFRIDLRTERTETFILLTREELKPIIEELTDTKSINPPEQFYL